MVLNPEKKCIEATPLQMAYKALQKKDRARVLAIMCALLNITTNALYHRLYHPETNPPADRLWWSLVLDKPINLLFPKD